MNLPQRISMLVQLGEWMLSEEEDWLKAKENAEMENGWFTPGFIQQAVSHIAHHWLRKESLEQWAKEESTPLEREAPRLIGIVMAGNIPLVGFHDWLAVYIAGHRSLIKLSSKDQALFSAILQKLSTWEPQLGTDHRVAERLSGCDAYIATGSNNSSRYFEYYFGKYPHIIRRNRTSVALLGGRETPAQLEALADDVHGYFGLGCRNVTKLYVPEGYDFVPLLDAFKKYAFLADHHKYKNNYDYILALCILNKKYYMTNGSILLLEDTRFFAPVSQLNYEFYSNQNEVVTSLKDHPELQCLVGEGGLPFGQSQQPALHDYADGVNSLSFLNKKMLN